MVDFWRTNRRTRCWFTFALAGVAFCVFAWSVQYRFSPCASSRPVPHRFLDARFLTSEQQATADDNPLLRRSKTSTRAIYGRLTSAFSSFLTAPNLLNPPASGQSRRKENHSWSLCRHASFNTFFFRPPPALL